MYGIQVELFFEKMSHNNVLYYVINISRIIIVINL